MKTVRSLAAAGISAVLLSACASTGSVGSFRGVHFPVMLGPLDRVRMTTPATVTKVDDWYTEAVNFASSQDVGSTRVTTETREATSFMAEGAVRYMENEHKSNPALDMKVTKLEATAYVTAFGGAAKEFVRVETDIVRHGESK